MEWEEMPWSRDYHSWPNAGRDQITPIDELMSWAGADCAANDRLADIATTLDNVVGPIHQMYHPTVITDLLVAFEDGYNNALGY